jgi:polar amino acid transport system substrate-binding protein
LQILNSGIWNSKLGIQDRKSDGLYWRDSMKRMYSVLVLVLTLILLTAVTAPAGPALDRILQKGELVVGTSGDQPPLTVRTKDGEIIGLDVQLAELMATSMGVKLKLVDMPFPELLPALEAGKVDMVLSGMTITPRRNLKVAFVGPYYVSGKGLLAKAQTVGTLRGPRDMNNPDFTVAALKNSTSEIFVEKALPEAKHRLTQTLAEAVRLLFKDEVQALIADYPYCAVAAHRYRDKGLAVGEARFTYEPLGIALPADDPLLVNWVGNFLATLQDSGDMKRLVNRWFKDASWIQRLP